MSQLSCLLAEDDPAFRGLIERVLRGARPEIALQTVSTGQEFLDAFEKQNFDCVLLDFNLPDYQADELLQCISDKTSHCPVIVISNSEDQSVVTRSLRNGSVDFIPKSEAMQGDALGERLEAALLKQRRADNERRQMVRRVKRLTQLAETDPLTGLSNRLHLERILSGQRQIYDRRGPVSCVMLDLDHFKCVNDTYGHLAGDRVLCCAADILKKFAHPDDTVCRWGGEEFLLLLSSCSLGQALLWAEAIRKVIGAQRIRYEDNVLQVTASFGVETCRHDALDHHTLAQADRALYLAKCHGRNRVCTGQMVALEAILVDMTNRHHLSPEQRLKEIISQSGDLIGPTQREHLTNHSMQVSEWAVRLGSNLKISPRRLDRLRLAGLFHDVGKFMIPEDLLAKPSALTSAEREIFSRHAQVGAMISRRLGVDSQMAKYIRYHHTPFDHSRKPGQNERAIPLGANVLAVADAFVAMTTTRPYHTALSRDAAVQELRRNCGTQFDPKVVEALEQAIN